MARRIQLKRTKGWRKPEGAVVVTRPGKWGNRFIGEGAVFWLRYWLIQQPKMTLGECERLMKSLNNRFDVPPAIVANSYDRGEISEDIVAMIRDELPGKDLCCVCHPARDCHADVLLELANA